MKEKSDAPKETLRTVDLIPVLGPLRAPHGVQIVWLQSGNEGEFINEPLISGCQARGVCMLVGTVQEQMRK
eukprot:12917869-Prorocentrum_lima.AAC.1